MAKIVLLSCTKSKLDHKAPAQELYSASPMFKKTLEYGKSLKEMPKDEKEKWGEETVKQMKSHGLNLDKDKFIFLTGSEYLKPFKEYIPEKNMEKPMEGRRLGERLKWLNTQMDFR